MPDLGLATLNDMRDNASLIASLDSSVPVIADADTGVTFQRTKGRWPSGNAVDSCGYQLSADLLDTVL
ncbi:carboxyphosphonoenolpyruvate mutase [Penicillium alfredii]|uniref:Carboxyphosphonoenolpyruvate mutase n=1 Tax=Penicillium alfredii TaxID=1506179 RepID=A0A9W9EGV9_9EURO|nr:carboxyphosphonoenolpyruvate mutase [Penicillium alfredii]KAJ5081502.1 carboxyphosphonoenolpyruvate mutase [Penicillium alfredii]